MSDFSDEEKLACIEREVLDQARRLCDAREARLDERQPALARDPPDEAIARDYRARVQPDVALS
jgi:hypothetical protein